MNKLGLKQLCTGSSVNSSDNVLKAKHLDSNKELTQGRFLGTLNLSRGHGDRWGATDIATLSLHLILFSASLRVLQNCSPVYSEILFSQRFFCRPLLLPLRTVSCKTVLTSSADLETCPNHFLGNAQQPEVRPFPFKYVSTLPNLCCKVSLLIYRGFAQKPGQNLSPRIHNVYFWLRCVAQKSIS